MKFTNEPAMLARLRDIDCFVLDMDGTFYLGNVLLEGSLEFKQHVEEAGKRILFLTNNSSRNQAHYVKKLAGMGCATTPDNVYTSGMATCQYLKQNNPSARVYLLGNENLQEEFLQHGITLTETDPDLVVVGYDTTLTYQKLCTVCDFIRAGLPYIATHPDFNCPVEKGFEPDVGAFMALIEASTGRKADRIIGKPYSDIVAGMLELTGLPPERMCICGDRLYTDIATGKNSGILSVCVLTGESTLEDIAKSQVKPDIVMDRLRDLIPYIG